MLDINKILFFLLGLVCTFAALQVNIGINLALYNYIIILIVILNILNIRKRLVISKTPFLWLFCIFTISELLNLYMLDWSWIFEGFKFIAKIAVLLLFIIIVGEEKIRLYFPVFLRGLYYSTIVQVIWEYLELLYWYVLNQSLNALIFGNILGIQAGKGWFTYHGAFRPTGLSWESANLSMSLIFGFVLSKKIWVKFIFFVSVLLGGSRTGMIGMVIAFVFTILLKPQKTKFRIFRSTVYKTVIRVILMTAIGCLAVTIMGSSLLDNFLYSMTNSFSRVMDFIIGEDASANRHIEYITALPTIFANLNFYGLFVGFGTQAAGLPYTKLFEWNSTLPYWSPESDFINILVSNGILGAWFYYKLLIHDFKRNNNLDIRILIIVIGSCGLMYVYIRTWTILFLALLSVTKMNGKSYIRDSRYE